MTATPPLKADIDDPAKSPEQPDDPVTGEDLRRLLAEYHAGRQDVQDAIAGFLQRFRASGAADPQDLNPHLELPR